MTNIATKNGSIIVKDGSVAEDCNCCGGWYCYDNPCDYQPEGSTPRRWICGEDQIPPATLSVKVTFSGQSFCQWGFLGDQVPSFAYPITYSPSTRLNKTVTLYRETIAAVRGSYVDVSGSLSLSQALHSFPCAYRMPQTSPAGDAEGLYSLIILPGNPYPGDSSSDWDCFAMIYMSVDRYSNFSAAVPYSEFVATNPSCSASESGTMSKTGLGSYDCPRGKTNYDTYRSDGGRYSQPNHLLSGVKWTLTWAGHPICTLEVVQ